ncbi:MAG: efflux RND transporter permease subunit, partial [Planctomycetes bacterium]|nr:efflux RND transporter permease subunit [Planctomycetota bacterium]
NIIEVAETVRKALYGTTFADAVSKEGESAYPNRELRNEMARLIRAGTPQAKALAQAKKNLDPKDDEEKTDEESAPQKEEEAKDGDDKESVTFNREQAFGLLDRMPDWMGVSLLTDQSVFIEASVNEVRNAVIIGGLLAIFSIFLFLRRAWSTFLISLSIILSVVATFIPMGMSGLTLNLMSLGGLALGVGMLVDNSIVVLESIARCREEGDDIVSAAARGTGEVASAIVASTLTTIAVFFPIVFVEGMVGQVFKEQSLTVVFSLLASLVVALLVIPAYAGLSVRRGEGFKKQVVGVFSSLLAQARWSDTRWKNIAFAPLYTLNTLVLAVIALAAGVFILLVVVLVSVVWAVFMALRGFFKITLVPFAALWAGWWKAIELGYAPVLRGALEKPAVVLGLAGAALALAFVLGRTLETELIPPLNENEFYVDVETEEGTRLDLTDRAAISALDSAVGNQEFKKHLRGVMVEVGGDASTTNRPVSSATVRYVVNLERGAPPVEEMGERLKAGIGEVKEFTSSPQLSRPSLFSLKPPVIVQVRGDDLGLLDLAAEELAGFLRELKRADGEPLLREVKTSSERGSPQILIRLDDRRLLEKGISKNDVADKLALAVGGETITDYEERGEKTDVFLSLSIDKDRGRTIAYLRNLLISTNPDVRLEELLQDGAASLRPEQGPSRILRTETEKVVEITATPNGVALGTVRDKINNAVFSSQIQSDDVRVTLAGQVAELEESNSSLLFALILAIFLVYVVMAVQFESLIDPLLIMGSVPLAAVGVIVMLWLTGDSLSVIVMLGAIVLAGIVVNNAIVLIDYANRLRAQGMNAVEAVHRAGLVRLRPIAITTLTTVLGMLPLTGWTDGSVRFVAEFFDGFPRVGDFGQASGNIFVDTLLYLLSLIPHPGDFFNMLVGSGEGQELRAPMAKTVVVGLSTSTFLTLLVIPTLYALVHSAEDRRRANAEQSSEA